MAERIGRLAVRSLYHEVALHPKPGLVSPMDNGSHADMNMATFFRSLFALRHYFPAIARAGSRNSGFAELQRLGIQAEREMLAATGGVNTHRGAIFNLGLLCASAALSAAVGEPMTPEALCRRVAQRWGRDILAAGHAAPESHGLEMSRRHGAAGARAQAAAGFPDVMEGSLPAYREALSATGDPRRAALQALFVLMARLEDSNLLWRGGPDGLGFARSRARNFLSAGGVLARDWLAHARDIERAFVARRLSPGGSADLLAVTLFLHASPAERS
ncbi:MAG TPA: triphosphoribosyl-dephospho-CoA synthase MdcB [Burkholderiales bacterium]|nr:triphosphoribosyl-dephospho-CoA synthase MdcB [Burkholderiales bacterium]